MADNKFITFEGIDGVDKKIFIDRLAKKLRAQGHDVTVTREPFGTSLGQDIYGLMSQHELDHSTQSLLMFAMRFDHVRTVIQPALERGEWVLSDRYNDSTSAFQSFSTLAYPSHVYVTPDVTFYFHTGVDKIARRMIDDSRSHLDLTSDLERVQRAYAKIAKRSGGRVVILNSESSAEMIDAIMMRSIRDLKSIAPSMELYTKESLVELEESIDGKNEYSERVSNIINKLKKSGNRKEIIAVPDDIDEILEEFDKIFPNFIEFSDFMRDYFALALAGDRRFYLPPMLFLGSSGIGKTKAAIWLAEKFGCGHKVIDMGSAQSGAPISGADAFYSTAKEGGVFEILAYKKIANPIVIMEEIDKASSDIRHDPLAPLHVLLEEDTAKVFNDNSIRNFPIDASNVVWFATANSSECIIPSVLKRFTVFKIPAPTKDQMGEIVVGIYRDLISERSWGGAFPHALGSTVIELAKGSGLEPRSLKKVLERAFAKALRGGRDHIAPEDVVFEVGGKPTSMGFISPSLTTAKPGGTRISARP